MIRIATWRSLRNWHIAFAGVVAGFLLLPRASNAACGDYVRFRHPLAQQAHSMPDLSATNDGMKLAAESSTRDRPCRGPNCSGGSFPAPQAPLPSVVVTSERAALAPVHTFAISVSSDGTLAEPSELVLDGFRLSILRPPR